MKHEKQSGEGAEASAPTAFDEFRAAAREMYAEAREQFRREAAPIVGSDQRLQARAWCFLGAIGEVSPDEAIVALIKAKWLAEASARPLDQLRQIEEGRPPSTYHWGEAMTTYATLGIGVEAWVELKEIEKRWTERRNNDLSGVSLSWRTFVLLMRVLRAIRIEDFREARARSLTQKSRRRNGVANGRTT